MIGKGQASEQTIEEIKALNPGIPILSYNWPRRDDQVIFKTISRDTYKYIMERTSAAKQNNGKNYLPLDEIHEAVFDQCVLWPKLTIEERYNLPVGVIPSVSKVIQERSGFLDVDIADRILAPEIYTTLIQPFPFWDKPSEEEIDELKKSTKFPLFQVQVESCFFVLRPMTRTDIKISTQAIDDRLALTRQVTLWPEQIDWDIIPAGWIEALGRAAADLSGWDSEALVSEL